MLKSSSGNKPAVYGALTMEASRRVNSIPFTQALHDFIHLAFFIFEAFAGIHIGNMDDGF